MQRKRLMRKMVETAGETALSKRRGWDGIRKEKDRLREERRVTHGDKQDGRHVGLGLTSTSKCSQNISTPTSKVTDQNNTPNQTHLCCFSSPCPPSARKTHLVVYEGVLLLSTAQPSLASSLQNGRACFPGCMKFLGRRQGGMIIMESFFRSLLCRDSLSFSWKHHPPHNPLFTFVISHFTKDTQIYPF